MKNYRINLLPKGEENIGSKIIYFGLHYLRYIIILTQIVVIGVFFYRFKIDQDLADLKESVLQKQEIFKITLPLVEEAQAVDLRANTVKGLLTEQKGYMTQVDYIFKVIPAGIVLDRIEISETTIKMSGQAFDVKYIKLLSQKITNDNLFKKVSVSQVEKNKGAFEFIILITR